MISETNALALFPPEGHGAPKIRRADGDKNLSLPAGTIVFSSDNHISLAEDIWYERFPVNMKDRAPRVWYQDGVFHVGTKDGSLLPLAFQLPLSQFEVMPGTSSLRLDARMADLDASGMEKELVFPNAVLALLGLPDLEVRDLCFRIYNEYIAELQGKVPGRFYGAGLINWWDAKETRRSLTELKALGLRTYLLPLNPFADADGKAIDWSSSAQTSVWEEIEQAGLSVAHHIGEQPKYSQYNAMTTSLLHNLAPFREMFGKYIFGGILDRHPSLRIGWFEGGINWAVSTLQDAVYANSSYRHMHNWDLQHDVEWYWRNHMCASFTVDPLGLELIERVGAEQAMWASDYPHIESTFGYTKTSIQCVIDAVDIDHVPAILGGNVMRFLGL